MYNLIVKFCMNELLLLLNFGCLRVSYGRYESYRLIFMLYGEHNTIDTNYLKFFNYINKYSGPKNILEPIKKNESRQRHSRRSIEIRKKSNILNYRTSYNDTLTEYDFLFYKHNMTYKMYIFGMFNTQVYSFEMLIQVQSREIIQSSRILSHYFYNHINNINPNLIGFVSEEHSFSKNDIRQNNGAILLNYQGEQSVIKRKQLIKVLENKEEIKNMIRELKESLLIKHNISTVNLIFHHVIKEQVPNLYTKEEVLRVLEEISDRPNFIKEGLILEINRDQIQTYFDISSTCFIFRHMFHINVFYNLHGVWKYLIKLMNITDILIHRDNHMTIKITIDKYNYQTKKYSYVYHKYLDPKDVNINKVLEYKKLLQTYNKNIRPMISNKILNSN